MGVVLELGCGPTLQWHAYAGLLCPSGSSGIGIDVKPGAARVLADLEQGLPILDRSVDGVVSFHFLEHLSRVGSASVIGEAWRVLKSDRWFLAYLPNLAWCAAEIVRDGHASPTVLDMLYGQQKDGHDLHRMGWTPRNLTLALETAGFSQVSVTPGRSDYEIVASAYKAP